MDERWIEFLLLQYAPPSQHPTNIGVLVWDAAAEQLLWKIHHPDNYTVNAEDYEYLTLLSGTLAQLSDDLGPKDLLAFLETTLSNILLLTQRQRASGKNAEEVLYRLFRDYVSHCK
jgi:hypothetical protein